MHTHHLTTLTLALALTGCIAAQSEAAAPSVPPTPVIVYVTATPQAASPTPTATLTATPTFIPTPTATPAPQVTLAAVGDIMLGRKVNLRILEMGEDYTWPFQPTAAILQSADITIGNLEGPIIEGCYPTAGRIVFCFDPRSVDGLVWAGFDALSVANNHRWDYFAYGAEDTVEFLEGGGIAPLTPGTLVVREVDGITVGLIGLDDTLRFLDLDALAPQIQAAASQVDVLVGMMHWGWEYTAEANARQTEAAHTLIDSGMDVVVGSHPHWVQPVETYNGGLIFYSLGNFVFDQMADLRMRDGYILRLTITQIAPGQFETTYELLPTRIFDYGQPRLDFDPLLDIDPGTPPQEP